MFWSAASALVKPDQSDQRAGRGEVNMPGRLVTKMVLLMLHRKPDMIDRSVIASVVRLRKILPWAGQAWCDAADI